MTARTDPRAMVAEPIRSARLDLSPLRPTDAEEMVEVLADPLLYSVIGGEPPTLGELRRRYERLAVGRSHDGHQQWLNWVVRVRDDGGSQPVGTVQATVTADPDRAEVAWVVGTPWQGHGYASEAAGALVAWLRERGVGRVVAHVAPGHLASEKVAAAAGLRPTAELHDGERVHAALPPAPPERRSPC